MKTDEFGGVLVEDQIQPEKDEFGGVIDRPVQSTPPSALSTPPSALATAAQHAAAGVAPGAAFAAGAIPGAKYGAMAGAAIPGLGETGIPEAVGAFVGGLVTGGVASWAAYKAQHAALEKAVPAFTAKMDKRLQEGAEAHPFAAVAGDVAGNIPSMELAVPKLAQLPFRAALGATVGAVLPLAQGHKPTLQDAATGALMASAFGRSRFEGAETPPPKPPEPKIELSPEAVALLPRAAAAVRAVNPSVAKPVPTPSEVEPAPEPAPIPPHPDMTRPAATTAEILGQKGQVQNASEISQAAAVHANVPPQSVASAREMPGAASGEGVQPTDENAASERPQAGQVRKIQGVNPEFAGKTEAEPLNPAKSESVAEQTARPAKPESVAEQTARPAKPESVAEQTAAASESGSPKPFSVGPGAASGLEPGLAEPPSLATHGVARRVTRAGDVAGTDPAIESGRGVSVETAIKRGEYDYNAHPDRAAEAVRLMEQTEQTEKASAKEVGFMRAHGLALKRAWNDARKTHGIGSEQSQEAKSNYFDWQTRYTRAVLPIFHEIGQTLHAEVELETGNIIELESLWDEAVGRPPTPGQKRQMEAKGQANERAAAQTDAARKKVLEKAPGDKKPPVDAVAQARKALAGFKPGQKMTTEQVRALWNAAKRGYLDKLTNDFDDVRHGLATDLGIPVRDVTEGLTQPKALRAVTDEMYRRMAEQRRLISQSKAWVRDQATPGWLRFARSVPKAFFAAKIFGHGTVGMITHAGLNIFNPGAWKSYWPKFFRQYHLIFSAAAHERMMQDLERDPLSVMFRRAGLQADPFKHTDSYDVPEMVKWFGKIGASGQRGFDALKLFRDARAKQIWNSSPESLRPSGNTREAIEARGRYAQVIANAVNHATGAVNANAPELLNWTFFAPKLEGSRWAWMIKDPWEAAKTFANWRMASPEARQGAMAELKQKAAIAGTYYGLLNLNQGILQLQGSQQQVNTTNPKRSDFMAFKVDGHDLGIVSPMLGMVRLFANVAHAAIDKRSKFESLTSRYGEESETAGNYVRGKLSPFAAFGVDVASQSDMFGKPLPFSSDKVPKNVRERGEGRYSYPEYLSETFLPIPAEAAIKEVWSNQGIPENDQNRYLNALLTGAVEGGTGARLSSSQKVKPNK